MPRTTIAVLGSVGLILGSFTLGSCADATPPTEPAAETEMTAPGDVTAQFAGTWELVGIERRGADGELLPSDSEDRVGYIMYDPAGYMGVVIQRGSRQAYADVRPTSEEAREALRTYTSYFGTFTVDAAKGVVTHHLRGSLNPSGAGSDYERAFEMSGKSHHLAATNWTVGRAIEADLAARARSGGADTRASTVHRLLGDRVGRTADGERRDVAGEPVRGGVHPLHHLRTHGRSSHATGPTSVRGHPAHAGGSTRGHGQATRAISAQ